MNTSRINPLDHRRTELIYNFYFADPTREAEIEDTIARNLAVVREDFEICIETHKNYATEAYSAGPLSPRHEAGVAYFQDKLKESLGLG
jgi:choline monooxygenase